MWFSCDITYNSPEISIKCRHLNHSTSISVGFFQTHYRLQSASPWWHTGRRKRWRRETLRFGFLFPMGSMGTICIFTYMEWLICHGQLQVVEKFTSPIDPIWVWEMVHFMIGRILMVNDMLRSFLLVFFFFGGGDGYRFAICYLRYVEWYIYIYVFFSHFLKRKIWTVLRIEVPSCCLDARVTSEGFGERLTVDICAIPGTSWSQYVDQERPVLEVQDEKMEACWGCCCCCTKTTTKAT